MGCQRLFVVDQAVAACGSLNVLQEVSGSNLIWRLASLISRSMDPWGWKVFKSFIERLDVLWLNMDLQVTFRPLFEAPGPTGPHHRHSRGFREAHRFGVEQGGLSPLKMDLRIAMWLFWWAILLAKVTPEMNGNEFQLVGQFNVIPWLTWWKWWLQTLGFVKTATPPVY